MSCSSFYLFSFFSQKIVEQEGETGSRAGTSGRREVLEKGGRRVNTVEKSVYTW
jgi:hypothetical protein